MISAVGLADAHAQSRPDRDGYPYSIMRDEPGQKRARPKAPGRSELIHPEQTRLSEAPLPRVAPHRMVRRGSSSLSAVPAYRSPLTPLGQAPRVGTVQPMGPPSSRAAPMPGVAGQVGQPAIIPGRPAGQGFQDRAITCTQSAGSQAVGAGQVGAFTRACVNR